MKNMWKKGVGLWVLAAMVAIGCSKTEEMTTPEVTDDISEVTSSDAAKAPLDESSLVFPEERLIESPQIQEGNENVPFALIDDGLEIDEGASDLTEEMWAEGASDGPCRIQGLSDLQKRALRRAHRRYCQCACGIQESIRQIHRQILARANQKLRELVDQFRTGQLTPQEFHQKLLQLIRRTRQALRNNPQKQQLLQALRQCKRNYARAAHGILNDRQFRQWVKCRQARRCRCHDPSPNTTN